MLSHAPIAGQSPRHPAMVAPVPRATAFAGEMTLLIHSHYYENAYLDGVLVSVDGGGGTDSLGRYKVRDTIDTRDDPYNAFFYGNPRGHAAYQGSLHFDSGLTLKVKWELTSEHTESTYAHQITQLEGEIVSASSGRQIGEVTGEGTLTREHFDNYGQDWTFTGEIKGVVAIR